MMVLIHSGSTHNFLSDKVARTLRLPVVPTKFFTVHVANRERLLCQGRFEKVLIDLQGIVFFLSFYSLPLAGLDENGIYSMQLEAPNNGIQLGELNTKTTRDTKAYSSYFT